MNAPTNPSAAVRRRNPHLWPTSTVPEPPRLAPRIRQGKPGKGSALQSAFGAWLRTQGGHPGAREEAITLQVANGVTYRPDYTAWSVWQDGAAMDAWEVKGPFFWPQARVKLKCAAAAWPEIRFWLVSRDEAGGWRMQRVWP